VIEWFLRELYHENILLPSNSQHCRFRFVVNAKTLVLNVSNVRHPGPQSTLRDNFMPDKNLRAVNWLAKTNKIFLSRPVRGRSAGSFSKQRLVIEPTFHSNYFWLFLLHKGVHKLNSYFSNLIIFSLPESSSMARNKQTISTWDWIFHRLQCWCLCKICLSEPRRDHEISGVIFNRFDRICCFGILLLVF